MGCIPASHDFLRTARDLADNYGSPCFDEVMTGFSHKGSAQEFTT